MAPLTHADPLAARKTCGPRLKGATAVREVLAIVRPTQPDFTLTPQLERAITLVYPYLGEDSDNLEARLVLAGAPADDAFTIVRALAIPETRFLSAQERDTFAALLPRRLHWTARMERAAAFFLRRGYRPLRDAEFELLGQRLFVGRSDEENADAATLLALFRRAQRPCVAQESIGTETALPTAPMLAIKRHVVDNLIAQSGTRMVWDKWLEGVAHQVIENGRGYGPRDFDYYTRALRNRGSNPVMIQALMRVLRTPEN